MKNNTEAKNWDDEETLVVGNSTFGAASKPSDNIPPCLMLISGNNNLIKKQWFLNSQDITAEEYELSLGRNSKNEIHIKDPNVSREHAILSIKKEGVFIRDLGSRNGTRINNKTISSNAEILLEDNDRVSFGALIFKFLSAGNIEIISDQKTWEQIHKDSLTGVYNKRYFETIAPEYFGQQNPVSLTVLDIDWFKKINDTYGHQAGDHILRQLAQKIKSSLREEKDILCRYGGEEFVIFSLSDLHQATEMAKRIFRVVEENDFVYKDVKIDLSISMGVAEASSEMKSWKDLFEKADALLYKAKESGRKNIKY